MAIYKIKQIKAKPKGEPKLANPLDDIDLFLPLVNANAEEARHRYRMAQLALAQVSPGYITGIRNNRPKMAVAEVVVIENGCIVDARIRMKEVPVYGY